VINNNMIVILFTFKLIFWKIQLELYLLILNFAMV